MARIQFRLSTLLVLFTVFAIAIGLGYQVHTLRRDVTQLRRELTAVKQQGTVIRTTFTQPAPPPAQTMKTPFRLLNTDVIVNPSLEDGMRAGELEHKQRIKKFRDRDELQVPPTPQDLSDKLFSPQAR